MCQVPGITGGHNASDECAVHKRALKMEQGLTTKEGWAGGLEGGGGECHAMGQEPGLTTREQEADSCMQERLSKIETRLEHLETKLSQVC